MRCFWGLLHRWSRWRDAVIYRLVDGEKSCGQSLVQERECLECGRRESREMAL